MLPARARKVENIALVQCFNFLFYPNTEEQIADQKKRKLKEKERKVDWWELRKAPDTEFKVRPIIVNILSKENWKEGDTFSGTECQWSGYITSCCLLLLIALKYVCAILQILMVW